MLSAVHPWGVVYCSQAGARGDLCIGVGAVKALNTFTSKFFLWKNGVCMILCKLHFSSVGVW